MACFRSALLAVLLLLGPYASTAEEDPLPAESTITQSFGVSANGIYIDYDIDTGTDSQALPDNAVVQLKIDGGIMDTAAARHGTLYVGPLHFPVGSFELCVNLVSDFGTDLEQSCMVKPTVFPTPLDSVLTTGIAPKVTIQPSGGNFKSWVQVTFSLPDPRLIEVRYTLDGTTPTRSSPLYNHNSGLLVSGRGPVTVKAAAARTANRQWGPLAEATFNFADKVEHTVLVLEEMAPPRYDTWHSVKLMENTVNSVLRRAFDKRGNFCCGEYTRVGGVDQFPPQHLVLATFAETLAEVWGDFQVCEIGFNTGHSASMWLTAAPKASYLGFDLGDHWYNGTASALLRDLYGERFQEVVWGDSVETIPRYLLENPDTRCNLIMVDGGHVGHTPWEDLRNMAYFAQPGKNIVVMDDVGCLAPSCLDAGKWWDEAIVTDIIEEHDCLTDGSDRGFCVGTYPRHWREMRARLERVRGRRTSRSDNSGQRRVDRPQTSMPEGAMEPPPRDVSEL